MNNHSVWRLATFLLGLVMMGAGLNVASPKVALAQCDTTPDFDTPWSAEFYNNQTFTGTPILGVYDQNGFSATWAGSPIAGINADGWSARIIRYVDFAPGGAVTFTMTVDDVGSLYIDDVFIGVTSPYKDNGTYTASGSLAPGSHKIIINVVDFAAEAYLNVDWTGSSTGGGGTCATAVAGSVGTDFNLGTSEMIEIGAVRARVGLNLRGCPSFDCNKMTLLKQGTSVQLLARTADAVWLNVVVNGQSGWLLTEWVDFHVDLRHIPVTVLVSLTGPTNTGTTGNSGTSSTDASANTGTTGDTGSTASTNVSDGVPIRAIGNVRVRECPSANCARLGYVSWGSQVMALGKSADGLWLKVRYTDPQRGRVIGWSSARWYFNDQFQPTLPDLPILAE